MEELVKLVSAKAGITPDQARTAITVVADFLKQKLPPPLAGQVDAMLAGGAMPTDLAQGLGGIFGKK